MKNTIDFTYWVLNIQRFGSPLYMDLRELEKMYQIYNNEIKQGKHTPYYL